MNHKEYDTEESNAQMECALCQRYLSLFCGDTYM